ncbi:helix-turn-helix transcriptional regulator [Bradyrhizobium liaoningense]|uniref:helix-turn-helix domain-containing protein n=1 Tax=Bradyrhizobium liaoningense TaxID=43992 RepID=UPI001BAAB0D2|nr:helix-turn-helix transcriptional regulator [Bradyrhizobium liaoningense]MBR0717172.1 helix-turn-helix transcriptional regulator [Bradyrhizobium liaoningense]
MSTETRPYPVVQDLIDSFAGWLKHRRELKEMREMDRFNFDRIASDLRVSPSELEQLVRHGPHAADELPKMLEQLGIDQERLGRTQPLLLRDLERVCALCPDKVKCHRDLAEHSAAEHYQEYCLNAPTLETLDHTAATTH